MTIVQRTWLADLQALVTNPLDGDALRDRRFSAILGDVPSTYAKSPKLWNAAFRALEAGAVYIPLDIPAGRLPQAIQLLRQCPEFLGGSVTVPYKSAVIPLLDGCDELTTRIGAVNVIVRTPEGRLVGHNTDGLGGLQAITTSVLPGQSPLMPELAQRRVLLLGAGGAAQAVAVYLWEALRGGELLIANRGVPAAQALVQRLADLRPGHVESVEEDAAAARAPAMDLIINATVKGQAGIRKLSDGRWTMLEPYSALAPARPAALAPDDDEAFRAAWFRESAGDIERNHRLSFEICSRLPSSVACVDLVYAPLESVFLRHARWSGHATLNGKAMNIVQAVEAFTRYVCRDWLAQLGIDSSKAYGAVTQAMTEQWSK